MSGYVVYILRTSGNTLYTGQTRDFNNRLRQHREGKVGAKYLRMFSSIEPVYNEEVKTIGDALKREAEIKRMSKADKEILIKLANDQNKKLSRK